MKKLIIPILGATALLATSACKSVVETPEPTTHTTTSTTEESAVPQQPVSATTTTETHSVGVGN